MKLKVFFFLILSSLFCVKGFSRSVEGVQPTSLPDFSFFKLEDNQLFTTQDIKIDKNIVLVLISAGCPHCQRWMEAMDQRSQEFNEANFYLVSYDKKADLIKFIEKFGKVFSAMKNVLVLQDLAREFVEKFRPKAIPAVYIYSPQGLLIKYMDGDVKPDELLSALNKG